MSRANYKSAGLFGEGEEGHTNATDIDNQQRNTSLSVSFPAAGGGAFLTSAGTRSSSSSSSHPSSSISASPSVAHIERSNVAGKSKGKSGGFSSLNLCPPLFKAIARLGYKLPTPIQRKAIPPLLQGSDVVAMARTGSGKTGAYLIPLLQRLSSAKPRDGVRAVILSPTRDLALQIFGVFKDLAKFLNLRCVTAIGGDALFPQFEAVSTNPDVIIATPGRLMQLLMEVKTFSLKQCEMIIFDEADRLIEANFAVQLHEILKHTAEQRQTALFSATLPAELAEFVRIGLKNPVVLRLDTDSKVSDLLQMQFFTVRKDEKSSALLYFLKEQLPVNSQVIVFVATRQLVEYFSAVLNSASISNAAIYGQMDSDARKIQLNKFRAKKVNVLVVTDLAARGIDIPLLDFVINYDFPSTAKLFVHRVGRVARAGRSGTAYSLVCPDDLPYLLDLFLFLGNDLKNGGDRHQQFDQRQCYYGNIPTHILEQEVEYIRNVNELNQLFPLLRSAELAYSQYYKTRSPASNASAARAKQLPVSNIHPMFNSEVDDNIAALESARVAIHNYRARSTVFELHDSKNEVMKVKRAQHDSAIRARHRDEDEKKATNQPTDGQMNSDEDKEERRHVHAEADAMQLEAEQHETAEDVQAMLRQPLSADGNTDSQVQKQQEMDVDKTSAVSLLLSANKRKRCDEKARLSKKQRKMLKTSTDAELDLQTESDTRTTADMAEQSKAKTRKSSKDEQFFMSSAAPNDSERNRLSEAGFAIRHGNSVLDSATLTLVNDEQDGMRRSKIFRRWDRTKRNWVNFEVSTDPLKKMKGKMVRDEQGKLVAEKYVPGELYAKWQKKNKKAAHSPDAQEDDEQHKHRHTDKRMRHRTQSSNVAANIPNRQVKSELRNSDEIRKLKKDKEFHRLKNRKGGFKAAAKSMAAKQPSSYRKR